MYNGYPYSVLCVWKLTPNFWGRKKKSVTSPSFSTSNSRISQPLTKWSTESNAHLQLQLTLPKSNSFKLNNCLVKAFSLVPMDSTKHLNPPSWGKDTPPISSISYHWQLWKHTLSWAFVGNLSETMPPKYPPFPKICAHACSPLYIRGGGGRNPTYNVCSHVRKRVTVLMLILNYDLLDSKGWEKDCHERPSSTGIRIVVQWQYVWVVRTRPVYELITVLPETLDGSLHE